MLQSLFQALFLHSRARNCDILTELRHQMMDEWCYRINDLADEEIILVLF